MVKKGTIVCGVDEAGRGAVIGPMMIAGVSVFENDIPKLKRLGVRDSKELTPEKREKLAERIENIAKDIMVFRVGPCVIDDHKKQGVNLNKLEAMKMAMVLDCLGPHKAFIDGPEKNIEKFKRFLGKLTKSESELVVENFADKKYPVVSAASIIAKVERDKAMEEIRTTHGVKGTGYPSDERTIRWMKAYLKQNKKFPERGLVRFTWETTREILGEHKQRKLFGFFRRK